MATPEGQILKAVLDYLAARHIFAVRMNSGTQIGSHAGKKWAIHMNAAGTADVLAFTQTNTCPNCGWFRRCMDDSGDVIESLPEIVPLWLEVKAPEGVQSATQKSFQAKVESEGHRYAVVRSVEDVEALLKC